MGHSASFSRRRTEQVDRRIELAELEKKQLQELLANAELVANEELKSIHRNHCNGESSSTMDSHVKEHRRLVKTISLNRLVAQREGIVHHKTMVKRRSVQDIYGLNS